MSIGHATNMGTLKNLDHDDLDIELTATEGTDHMEVASHLIGKVIGSIKWRIGSPNGSGRFMVNARGWGIRGDIETALGNIGGKFVTRAEPPEPEKPPSFEDSRAYRTRWCPDSAAVLGDSCQWAS